MSFQQVQRSIYLVQAALESPDFILKKGPFSEILDVIDKANPTRKNYSCVNCKTIPIKDCIACNFFACQLK